MLTNQQTNKRGNMKKDKYGVEIKVGDFVLLDTMEGREYPNMCSGQMFQHLFQMKH